MQSTSLIRHTWHALEPQPSLCTHRVLNVLCLTHNIAANSTPLNSPSAITDLALQGFEGPHKEPHPQGFGD